PGRRRAASSAPDVPAARFGACVLARHPPVTTLGATVSTAGDHCACGAVSCPARVAFVFFRCCLGGWSAFGTAGWGGRRVGPPRGPVCSGLPLHGRRGVLAV